MYDIFRLSGEAITRHAQAILELDRAGMGAILAKAGYAFPEERRRAGLVRPGSVVLAGFHRGTLAGYVSFGPDFDDADAVYLDSAQVLPPHRSSRLFPRLLGAALMALPGESNRVILTDVQTSNANMVRHLEAVGFRSTDPANVPTRRYRTTLGSLRRSLGRRLGLRLSGEPERVTPPSARSQFPDDVPPAYHGRSPRFRDAEELVCIGPDVHGREAWMHPGAAAAWRSMTTASADDGVTLLLVSAFRSVERQAEIVRTKRARGLPWEEILRVNAYPGFSEHHTGCAVDIGAPGCGELEETFDTTPEFRWLREHAAGFGFTMSYPPDNPWGIIYEPWHWRWWQA